MKDATEKALSIMRKHRDTLLKETGVSCVSLGVVDSETDPGLDFAIWVHADFGVNMDAIKDKDYGLPVVLINDDSEYEEQGLEGGNLNGRADPPTGGYQVGPNTSKKGTLGVTGYFKTPSPQEIAMVTALHIFEVSNKPSQLFPVVKQPASNSSKDVISDRTPIMTAKDFDIVIWQLYQSSRNWTTYTDVATLGTISKSVAPKKGMSVSKVGSSTGLTTGTVANSIPPWYFTVIPDIPSKPISKNGDSGAAWICTDTPGELAFVGIHIGQLANPTKQGQKTTYKNEAVLISGTQISTTTGFNIWNLGDTD
ncbi:MAG: hypothetical protein ACQ9MH_08370 [Nitrospinales bacterium]